MTPQDKRQSAAECLQLSYKYFSVAGCVESQSPELMEDPLLAIFAGQIRAANSAFEARLREMAGSLDEDGRPI